MKVIRILRVPQGLVALGVCVGPLIGLAAYRLAVWVEHDRAASHLQRRVSTAAFAIEKDLTTTFEVLYALQSHFLSGDGVTRESFASVARPFLARHPELHALKWIPCVGRTDRWTHEQRARAEGLPGYKISQQVSTLGFAAASDRDWFFPVAFVEPIEDNERLLGFDINSDRWCGRPWTGPNSSTTQSLPTHSDPSRERSKVMRHSRCLRSPNPGESRMVRVEQILIGFVLGVVDIAELVWRVQHELGSTALPDTHLELVDDDVDGGLVSIRGSQLESLEHGGVGLSAEQLIEMGGRRWRLVSHPSADFTKSLRTGLPASCLRGVRYVGIARRLRRDPRQKDPKSA